MLPETNIKEVIDYLRHNIGIEITLIGQGQASLTKLPFYLKQAYSYYKVEILDKEVIVVLPNTKEIASPEQLKKQQEMLQQAFSSRVVFVFGKLEAYVRKRLLQKKIAFLVPGKQLFIPFLFLELNESKDPLHQEREKLRPASQCFLLYHLQVASLEGKRFKEVALRLGYSSMTITRAVQELAEAGLADVIGTREKNIKFRKAGKELWKESLPLLQSPVKERVFLQQLPQQTQVLKAGITALAGYSEIAPGPSETYALADGDFKIQKTKEAAHLGINKMEGDYCLEIWSYAPKLLSKTETVDPLSLYLSLQHDQDERIEQALEQLIENTEW